MTNHKWYPSSLSIAIKLMGVQFLHCSTKGVGATTPDPSEAQAFENGIVVPLGKPKLRSDPKVGRMDLRNLIQITSSMVYCITT